MREIKFRAWDKKTKQMFLNYASNTLSDGGINVVRFHASSDLLCANWELMQFTGLKDKNGKEIYEGDILGQDCSMVDDYTGKASIEVQKLVVRWGKERLCWSVYCPDAMIKDDWNNIPRNAYVIGNIYENPELLEWRVK